MFQINFSKNAIKSFKRFPLKDQVYIKKSFERIRQNPFSLDTKKLKPPHQTSHRIRIGNYRIFLEIDLATKVILIVDIKRHTTQTYN